MCNAPVAAPSLTEPYKCLSQHTALQQSFSADFYEMDRAYASRLLMAIRPRREQS